MAVAKTYRATANLYVDERFIREGEVFTTAAPKGSAWEEVEAKPKGKAQSGAPVTGADD